MASVTKKHIEAFKKLRGELEQASLREDGSSDFWTRLYQEMEKLGCIDINYLEHSKALSSIDNAIGHVQGMSFDECCTWLTWALRGERFCDGLFAGCIKQGHIRSLLDRVIELGG